ncbi:SLITRK5 [Branchiostoma lanceolatum]|uniref:SLITRK5 protein n=1 Tax=Branchiostoma lanceolatum TaxID=7740 RepID=A0A8K0EBN2_BRALA|nr:SLITRK5 [Branchiostoma lanceolatum]
MDIEAGAFEGLGKVRSLYLSFNRLSLIENHFFLGLPTMRFISLKNNRIRHVSGSAFSSLGGLREVDLRCNRLQTVPWDAMKLPNKHTAKTFHLEGNKIRYLTPPPHDLRSMKPVLGIRLAQNPIKCDCHLAEFLEFFTANSYEKISVNDGELLLCDRPCKLKNTAISDLTPTNLTCEDVTGNWTTPASDGNCDLENMASKPTDPSTEDNITEQCHGSSAEQYTTAPTPMVLTTGQGQPPNPRKSHNEPDTRSEEVLIFMKDLTNHAVPSTNFTLSEYSDLLIYFIIIMIASAGISYILCPAIINSFGRKLGTEQSYYEDPAPAGDTNNATVRQSCHIYEDIDKPYETPQAEKDADQDSAFGDVND